MIKSAVLFISLLFSFTPMAFATQNPLIRNCHLAGGHFTEVKTHNDQIGLCEFGHSYLGSLDVLNYLNQILVPASVANYKDNITECEGEVVVTQVLNTKVNITICQFSDGSIMDLKTLTLGSSDPNHAQLNQFLDL